MRALYLERFERGDAPPLQGLIRSSIVLVIVVVLVIDL
jgi:hypothetical protein